MLTHAHAAFSSRHQARIYESNNLNVEPSTKPGGEPGVEPGVEPLIQIPGVLASNALS